MKKELFLEDILDNILNNKGNLPQQIRQLRDLIQYQRSFDNSTLAEILDGLNLSSQSNQPSISTTNLPYPVAYLIDGVNQQFNELVKVLFLCDAVECFVRWRLSEMMSVVHYERKGLPDYVLGPIPSFIQRPSMGSWISAFEHMAEQVNDKAIWGVTPNALKKTINKLREISSHRNKLAHGDINGNISTYWTNIEKLATEVFTEYRELKLTHSVIYNHQQYQATDLNILHLSSTIPAYASKINQAENYYMVHSASGDFQIPMTFIVQTKEVDTSDDTTTTVNFRTGSYISTSGKCNTINSGGSLEYTWIDAQGLYLTKELAEYVQLFKLGKDTQATESWLGVLDEVDNGVAWDVDRKIIKYRRNTSTLLNAFTINQSPNNDGHFTKKQLASCLAEQQDSLPHQKTNNDGALWYFGGTSRSSKSTVLLSYLKNATNSTEQLVFPHRFSSTLSPAENIQLFFQSLQSAIIFWLRKHAEVPNPDTSLTDEDLYRNVDELLEKLFTLIPAQSNIIIGLDDIHQLIDKMTTPQPILDRLLRQIKGWGRFVSLVGKKRGKDTYVGEQRQQIFCIATGLDISFGENEDGDIDDWMATHPNVHFVYDIQSIQTKSLKLSGAMNARWAEIQKFYPTSTPNGAHLAPIGHYGAKKILLDGNLDTQLIKALQPLQSGGKQQSRGEEYIDQLLGKANGNPEMIAIVAQNLQSGAITIDTPITPAIYDSVLISETNPFLQDISRLIPLLVVFIHSFSTNGGAPIPVSTTSLEILCGNDTQPNPAHNRYILEALYSMPKIVKKVALSESDGNGNLAFGWILRNDELPTNIDNLDLTQLIVQQRLLQLKNNIQAIADTLQLKDILMQKFKLSVSSNNIVQTISSNLRGALRQKIQDTLQVHKTETVLQHSADMLYQTAAIQPPGITWVQKASESATLHNKADQYTQLPSFEDYWLKHINTEHTPIFEHQQQSVGYLEKIEHTLPINDDYYLVIGKGYNSVAVYNIHRTQPDCVVLSVDSPDKAVDCVALSHQDNIVIAIAIDTRIDLHKLVITDRARLIPAFTESGIFTHDYQAKIKGLVVLDQQSIVIFGERNKTDREIDILSQIHTTPTLNTTLSSGEKGAPNTYFTHNNMVYGCFQNQLIQVQQRNNAYATSAPCTLRATPRNTLCMQQDILFIGATTVKGANTKDTRNCTWYSPTNHQSCVLQNNAQKEAFAEIIFGENISENHLLTVDYTGVLRIYQWGQSQPLCEIPLDVNEQTLQGGLLHDQRLLLYGNKAFMAFYDIQTRIDSSESTVTVDQRILLNLHFGAIKGAMPIHDIIDEHPVAFLTWSDDNDVRAWSWTSGSMENPSDYCIGLFRAHTDKVKHIHTHNQSLVTVDQTQSINTWKFNSGMRKQRDTLLEHAPAYINQVFLQDDMVWSVTSANSTIHLECYPKYGTQWTQVDALQQQTTGQFHIAQADPYKSILLGNYIMVLTRDHRLFIFDTTKQAFLTPKDLTGLSIHNWHFDSKANALLVYNHSDIYSIDDTLQLNHIYTVEPNEKISVAKRYDTQVYFAVTTTEEKTISGTKEEVQAALDQMKEVEVVINSSKE